MKYILIYLTLIISTVFANTPAEQTQDHWKTMDEDTTKVLNLIANDKLSDAMSTITELEKKSHGLPIYDCLRAANLYKILEEYRNREFEAEFNATVEKAVKALEDESKDAEKGPLYKAKRLQFLGSAYGYRGMFRTLSGLWASAFFDGKRAAGVLEESLVLDPSLVDNKAGIGTYLYWRSAKAGFVKYLLFWGDKKQEGIANLDVAVKDGKIIKQWALGGLLRIYIEEKNGTKALEYADKILSDIPDDTGTIRRKAMTLYFTGKKEESFKILNDKLLPLFRSKDNTPFYDGKKLNTANAQIETIYHILKIDKELDGKLLAVETKKKYKQDVMDLEKRITRSYSDIEGYVKKVKEF